MILGYHERDNKYIIGSKILYECEAEYRAYGSTMLECKTAGYWSDYPPKCLPKGDGCLLLEVVTALCVVKLCFRPDTAKSK